MAVGRAVTFAHSRGVLHRDLKGQNVVLGEFGEVFLLDWGLAKDDQAADVAGGTAAGSGSSEETQPGSVIGTPAFMAPEVAAGGAASRASDVYGLGGVLYQILTGHPPYDAGTAREVLEKVTTTDPPPVRELNPAAPPALAAICRKAMARDPAHRYASADELATDVRRWLADEPVTAYREPFAARAGRWARRHRTGVVAAGVLAIATAIGSAITAGLVWREKERTATAWRHAEDERSRAEANLDAAHRLTTGLVEVTEKLLPPVRGSELPRRDVTRAAAEMFAVFAGQRPRDPVIRRWAARLGVYDANLRRLVGDAAGADAAYRFAIDRLRVDAEATADLAAALRDRAGLTPSPVGTPRPTRAWPRPTHWPTSSTGRMHPGDCDCRPPCGLTGPTWSGPGVATRTRRRPPTRPWPCSPGCPRPGPTGPTPTIRSCARTP